MNWIRRHRPSPATGIALAALVIALGGAAFAAIPDSNGTIHGCYQKSNGNLRVAEYGSECRSGEVAIAWNQGAGVDVLHPITLGQGDRQVLLHAGSLTFTGVCKFASGNTSANVEVTTSQDHAAVVEDNDRFARRDLLVGETATLFGGSNTGLSSDILDVDFAATSPDHTVVTGIFSLGVNLGNDPGKCLIGGHVAVGQ
jgi:hypothetical protein